MRSSLLHSYNIIINIKYSMNNNLRHYLQYLVMNLYHNMFDKKRSGIIIKKNINDVRRTSKLKHCPNWAFPHVMCTRKNTQLCLIYYNHHQPNGRLLWEVLFGQVTRQFQLGHTINKLGMIYLIKTGIWHHTSKCLVIYHSYT